MSDDLQSLGVEALRGLLDSLTGAKAFALEQAPEVCQQLIAKEMLVSGLDIAGYLIGLTALSLIAFILVRRGLIWMAESDCEMSGMFSALIGTVSGVAAIPVLCGFVNSIERICVVSFAPKVFLLETIAHMVRD